MRSPRIRDAAVAVVFFVALAQALTESEPVLKRGVNGDAAMSRTRSYRPNAVSRSAPATPAAANCEYKELMTSLHDRVGILATLDEDQRHRLESIDKKVTQLMDSNEARMESIKTQQMDFQKRLDIFEHIQRLSRSTLDELKDLSRNTRSPQDPSMSHDSDDLISGIFQRDPVAAAASMSRSNRREINLDVPQRLEAIASLLASTAINVRELQLNISQLAQNTNNIQRRLNAHRRKGQHPYQQVNAASAPLPPMETATSCLQIYNAVNGVLKLQLTAESEPFYVTCEGDGWTVVLNRYNGNLNFERDWREYKEGFGNLAGEFFIGLEKLHALTASAVHELRIVLQDHEGNVTIADYNLFAIGSEKEQYPLNLLGRFQNGQPTAGDSLSYHAGAKFSTFDNDNDNCVECNCAQKHKGGWWYNWCATSNLLGNYYSKDYANAGESGIFWDTFRGVEYSLRGVKMLIRPVAGQDESRR